MALPSLDPIRVLFLDFCAHHNTIFKHKGVHQCTWHQDHQGRRSTSLFATVSGDLQLYVLDTVTHRAAELSTHHHLEVRQPAETWQSLWW